MTSYRTSDNSIRHYGSSMQPQRKRAVRQADKAQEPKRKKMQMHADKGSAVSVKHGKVNGDPTGHRLKKPKHKASGQGGTYSERAHGTSSGHVKAGQYRADGRNVRRETNHNYDKQQRQLDPRDSGQSEVTEQGGKIRYYYDTSLLCALIFIFGVGLLIIYSSSQYTAQLNMGGDSAYFFKRQLVIGCAGLAGAIIMSFLNYRWLNLLDGIIIKAAYGLSILALIATTLIGTASHGKTRWLTIFGVQFQPAEVAKITIILMLAWFIRRKGASLKRRENLLKAIAIAAFPILIMIKQSISSVIIVALITAVMLFVALDNTKFFAISGGIALAVIAGLKPLMSYVIHKTGYTNRPEAYFIRRVLGWAAPDVFPDDAYQTTQSLYAIGSGGMRGHGLGESIQKFGKLPEAQNDMIFSIVCEEFGFIGAATLMLLFFYIILRVYDIAKNADDLFGTMICTGVMAHLGIQVVLNIAVVTGVIPNTGVTLPFISYGGSAIMFTMLEMGLVLSVAHRIQRN